MPSAQPLPAAPREVLRVLRPWLAADRPPPLVVRTSGSSGEPKEVLLGRDAVLASARATLDRLGGPGQWLLALPGHYVAGLQVLVRSLLAGTDPVLLDDHPSLAPATAALSGDRRYISVVPTQLVRALDIPAEAAALARFDAVLVGGAAADQTLLERARAVGIHVVTTYGMSETCGGCVYDGTPLDGVGVRVAQDGRIHLRGPVLFDGYADRPDLTAAVLVEHAGRELRTPDLGRIADDGRLEVLGRADDVVVSGGVNVALPAVEERLRRHPQVRDAAVFGVPDPEWGTRVVAVVAGPPVLGEPSGLAQLRDHVAAELPRTWAPRQLVCVDALPLLPNHKIDRSALPSLLRGPR